MKSKVSMVIGIMLIFVAGMSFGLSSKGKTDYTEEVEIIKTYTDVLKIVEDNYVEKPKSKELLYGSLRGLLSSLDPYSTFFTPEEFKEFTSETQGEFGGLGIEITMENNKLLVVSPIEDTPAYKAGIKPGDWIVEINGEPTDKMTLFQAIKKMRGEPGTKVTLTIFRKGVEKPFKVELVRAVIKVKSLKTKELENGKIGYIRLSQFQENSADEFEKALKQFKNKEGIIIDLRNNPGGLLTSAISISSMILPKGKLIVYTKGRTPDSKEEFYSERDPVISKDIPIAVIVNKGSASASEILTGALKDNKRAIIVGDTTFGKASVQTLIPLQDGSGIKLTVAHYYTPNGDLIMNKGITPDIIVKMTEEEEIQKAKAERDAKLNGKDETEVKDPQLEAAINAVKLLNFAKKMN